MEAIKHHSSKTRVAQLGIFITGVFIFFDPYVSIMVVGKVLGSILKGFPLSSEKISFLIDTTAMPVASIFPKSSWIMFAADLIQTEIDNNIVGLSDASGYSIVLSTVKYQFYPILILGLIAIQLFTGREMGPILEAENQSRLNYNSKDQKIDGLGLEIAERSWNWCFPVFLLNILLWVAFAQLDINFTEGNQKSGFVTTTWVTSTMATILLTQIFFFLQNKDGNLCCLGDYFNRSDENRIAFLTDTFPSASASGSVSIPFEASSKSEDSEEYFLKGSEKNHLKALNMHTEDINEEKRKCRFHCSKEESLLNLHEGVECLVQGTIQAVPAILSLIFAWATGYVYRTLGIDRVVISWILSDTISTEALPIVVFFAAFFLSLTIGSSWCTISILIPGTMGALIDLLGDSEVIIFVLASILSGAAAGDHIGPFSETTILSALVTGSTVHQHFVTQAPYAIFVIALSLLIGTVPISFGAYPVFVGFILGFIVLIVFVIFVCQQVKRYLVSSGQSIEEPIARIIHSMLFPGKMECDEFSNHQQSEVESQSDEFREEDNHHLSLNETTSVIDSLHEGTEIVKIGDETSCIHGHTLQSFKTKLQQINEDGDDPILGLVEDGILPENFRSELQSLSQGRNSKNFSGDQTSTNDSSQENYENKKRMIEATIKKAEKDGNIFSESLRVFLRTAEQRLGKIMEGESLEVNGSTSGDSSGDDSLDNLMSDIAAKGWRERFNSLLGDGGETVTSGGGEDYTTDGSFLATDDSGTATSSSSADNGQSTFFSANGDVTSLGSTSTGPSYSTGISVLQNPLQFNKSRQVLQAWTDNESSSCADDEYTDTGDYTKASF
mmetsp:Transcript_12524/g.12287  ORF Transcript_12524/g.12287 Transcript_12524/m.12287 type:complete len:840 (+) Transcript_12524:1-2520(+)